VPGVEETKAHLEPALTTGVVPAIQLSVEEFAVIQLLRAKVAPFSKPPSPVGEIKVVCPCAKTKENNATNRVTNESQVRFFCRVRVVFLFKRTC